MPVFDFIAEWLNSGVYAFFTEAAAFLVKHAVIGYLEFINWAVPFAWGIAKELLVDLQLSNHINTALAGFDSTTVSLINYLRFPEAISTIATAGMTKLVFKFIPGL